MVFSFIITYSVYSTSQLIYLFRAKKKDNFETNSFTKRINLNSTSLIVPFRNESKRITEKTTKMNLHEQVVWLEFHLHRQQHRKRRGQ